MKKLLKGIVCAMVAACLFAGFAGRNAYAAEELTGITATEITKMMGSGWNLGNTFDATGGKSDDIYSYEQSWGNPVVTRELVDAIAASGFKTIRIPITWTKHISNDDSFTIDPAFLARVKEVVDYAYDDGLFIIINAHHESWINKVNLDKTFLETGKELGAVWSQVADYFADYDMHLIFEGMNEPRMAGSSVEWTGTKDGYAAINYLNQVFANAVRSCDKGHNGERCLMIPQYAASSSVNVMSALTFPVFNGKAVENIIASVHGYAPYDFCLSDKMVDFSLENTACTGPIDALFNGIDSCFLSKGIPVVLGETGATNKDNTEARENWARYMGEKSAEYGVPVVIWDNGAYGNSGGECHAWINRTTCEWNFPTVKDAFLDAAASVEWGSGLVRENDGDAEKETISGGIAIWSDPEGLTNRVEWDSTYIQFGAKSSWFIPGRDICVIYSGTGEPKIILDSEIKQAWWIPVDPVSIETGDVYKVATFTYDALKNEMDKAGVAPDELRNFCIVATNGSITTYEIACLGGTAAVNYLVNGSTYATGTDIPADPELPGLKFAGWYTTYDYREGTGYNGEASDTDLTVYSKFELEGDSEEPEAAPEPTAVPEPTTVSEPASTPEAAEVAEPTAVSEPSSVPEATEAPEPTAVSEPDAAPAVTGETAKTEDGGLSPLAVAGCVAAALALIAAVIIILKRKK